jgi:stage II sporulation protein D
MKKGFLAVSVVLMILAVVLFNSGSHIYAASYPDTIRIGLYYGSDSVPSVSILSKQGIDIGYYGGGKFTKVLSENPGIATIIRKDSYFITSSKGVTSEYNPAEGIPFEGTLFGPYHIRIGGAVSDYNAAMSVVEVARKSGVSAYPVYEGGWYVWTGFFTDSDKAQAEMAKVAEKLGSSGLAVVPPSSSRVVVLNSAYETRLIFGDPNSKLRVRAKSEPYLCSVNGRQYRGEFEIRRYADSDMTVINILNIEQYLYGVVPEEMESTAPLEALKAQAVAARNYAYINMGKYEKWGFDLTDTTTSQVYNGYDAEKASTNRAVDETRGKKVLYNGKLAYLYYFSSSGGMTEDNIHVWGSDVPYLKSVPDPYESGKSYNYNWTRTFTAEQLKGILFLSDVEIGDIVSVTAEKYSPAGRVIQLKFTGTKGQITYYRDDGKVLLGLPSQMYTISSGSAGASFAVDSTGATVPVNLGGALAVSADGTSAVSQTGSISVVSSGGVSVISAGTGAGAGSPGTFVFTGKGWGHGIGMSQEGAKGFALQGYTYDQILKHYFTGVTVE